MALANKLKRLSMAAVGLALALSAPQVLADHGTGTGQSFTFLQSPFTQEIFGVSPHFMGGVAFSPTGNPWVDDCTFGGSELHGYDRLGVAPEVNLTKLHPETVVPSNAGCGLTNHPNGTLYSNVAGGVVRLDATTGSSLGGPFGSPGNALGIAPDPQTGNLIYVGSDGNLYSVDPGLTTSAPFSGVTSGNFLDGIAWDPPGNYLFVSNRSPSYRLTILDRSGVLVQHVPMTSEPDGISFHAVVPRFVVTSNTDGTMTRFDFPGDDYTQVPVQSVFASGGFRGDLTQVGPDGCIYLTQNGTRYDDGTITGANSLVRICGGFAPPPGVEVCGDGIDNDGDGQVDEDCPDGPVCGNGLLETEEACDDGNVTNGDGCSEKCAIEDEGPVCGNKELEKDEACDDGNLKDGDGCSAKCTIEKCVVTQGYWKNHPSDWPVSSLTLGTTTYTKAQLLRILRKSPSGNGLISLAHQLIAAKLNVAAGVIASPSVAAAIAAADALIGTKVIPPIGGGTAKPAKTSKLTEELANFNKGLSGPLHCSDKKE